DLAIEPALGDAELIGHPRSLRVLKGVLLLVFQQNKCLPVLGWRLAFQRHANFAHRRLARRASEHILLALIEMLSLWHRDPSPFSRTSSNAPPAGSPRRTRPRSTRTRSRARGAPLSSARRRFQNEQVPRQRRLTHPNRFLPRAALPAPTATAASS